MNLQELQKAYENKEIGKEYFDKEVAKLNTIWGLIPEQHQESIQEGAVNTGKFLGEVWSDAREFEPWHNPLNIGSNLGALGMRGIEGAGHLSSKYIGQPVSSFAHNKLGIHKPIAGGIGLGAEMIFDPLAVGKLSKLSKSKKLHSLLKYQADSAAYNVSKNIKRIDKDVRWGIKQGEILTGNRLRTLDKPPSTFFDVDTIIDGSPKWASKVTAIYKNHEGGISWKQAMEMAKRNDVQMNIGYGNEIMNTGDNFNYLPNSSPDELLDTHKALIDNQTLNPNGLQNWGPQKRKSGARFTTGKTVQDEPKFIQAGWTTFTDISKNFGININRATSPLQIHHKGVVRQIAESLNGLTDEAAVKGGNIISEKVGFKLGYDPSNAIPVPVKFHQRIHDIINDRISLRWGDNLKGLEQKLNLPTDWKTTMGLQARIDAGIYDEIAAGINESTAAIDTFWKSLSARTNLGKLTKDEFLDVTLEVVELDKTLSTLQRTRMLSPEEGYTATQAVNEILERAGRLDLQSPVFDKLDPAMSRDLIKILIQRNGDKALTEVLKTGQDVETVFKAYGIKTKGYDKLFSQLNLPGFTNVLDPTAGKPLGRPKGSKTINKKKKIDKPDQGEFTVEWNKREYQKTIENLRNILDQQLPD